VGFIPKTWVRIKDIRRKEGDRIGNSEQAFSNYYFVSIEHLIKIQEE
jgi:hypothetical protein